MSGHTPGPWQAYPGFLNDADYRVYDVDGEFLTTADDTHAANARLIAAAPDLLEALDWLLACVTADKSAEKYPGDHDDRLELAKACARTALAKAMGAP